jgi:hypothetical protein
MSITSTNNDSQIQATFRRITDRELRVGLAARSTAKAALAELNGWTYDTSADELRRIVADSVAIVYRVLDTAVKQLPPGVVEFVDDVEPF